MACAECTRKCLMVHGNKKNHPPVAASFFKIMIGSQLAKVLFLPPKFAPTVSTLVGHKAVLEDSRGMRWRVAISRIDGSLAFEQGWNLFSEYHGLTEGELLVFNYIMSSHFIVRIYDRSGCEKLNFPETRNQKKKTRDDRTSTVKDDTCRTVHKSLLKKQGSGTSVVFGSDRTSTVKDGPCYATHKSSLNKEGFCSDGTCAVKDNACNTIHKSSLNKHGSGTPVVFVETNSVKDGPCHTTHKSSWNEQGLGTSGLSGSGGAFSVKDGACHTIHKSSLNKHGLGTTDLFGSNGTSAVKDGVCPTINKSSLNEQGSGTSVFYSSDEDIGQHPYEMNDMSNAPLVTGNASNYDMSNGKSKLVAKEENIEEMIWMDRELMDIQQMDRTYMFDLSDFEIIKMNIGTGGSNEVVAVDETCSHQDDSSLWFRNEAGSVDKKPLAKEAMTTATPMDETCSGHDDSAQTLRNGAGSVDNNPMAMEEGTAEIPVMNICSYHDDSSPRMRKEVGSADKNPVAKEAVTTAIPVEETCSHRDDSSLRLRNEASSVDTYPVAMEEDTREIPVARKCADHDDSSPTLRNGTGSVGTNAVAIEVMTTEIPLDETQLGYDDSSPRMRNEVGSADKNRVAKEAVTKAIPLDASKFNRTGEINVSEDSYTYKTSGNLFPTAAVKPEENERTTSNFWNSGTEKCPTVDLSESISNNWVAVPRSEHDLIDDSCQGANKEFTGVSESFDAMMKTIKIECVALASDPCSHNLISPTNGESLSIVCSQISDMIESDPVDSNETLSGSSNFSCLVAAGSQSFLELPVSMPMPTTVWNKRRFKRDRRVVLLRDPVMRVWPVLYIEKYSFKLLFNGWEAFSKANNIEEGDGCLFQIDNESEALCSVQIIKQ